MSEWRVLLNPLYGQGSGGGYAGGWRRTNLTVRARTEEQANKKALDEITFIGVYGAVKVEAEVDGVGR